MRAAEIMFSPPRAGAPSVRSSFERLRSRSSVISTMRRTGMSPHCWPRPCPVSRPSRCPHWSTKLSPSEDQHSSHRDGN